MERKDQMTEKGGSLNLDKALLDPGSMFPGPEEVRDHPGLTCEQKIEILRRWAYDASELALAEEEGMLGGEPSQLAQILSVLDVLSDGFDVEHSPPPNKAERRVNRFVHSLRDSACNRS